MKTLIRIGLGALFAMLLICCAPSSKEQYMERYKAFIEKVSKDCSSYTDEDWQNVDQKFDLYKVEYYELFKSELTYSEKLTLVGYNLAYKYLKIADGASDYVNGILEDPEVQNRIDKLSDNFDSIANSPEFKKSIKEVENYLENDLSRDLERVGKFFEENIDALGGAIESLGKSLQSLGE